MPIQDSKRNIQNWLRLPVWARPSHPIVRRELELLPAFLGRDFSLRTIVLFAGLAALGIGPCSCLCGGVLAQGLALPLSLLPIIWAGQVINRDVISGQWGDLRLTPFSVSEVVLAKLFAVVYRLAPLLALIVAVQVVSGALAAGFTLLLAGNTIVNVNGTTLQLAETGLFPQNRLVGLVIGGVLLLVVTAFQATLDFMLNVAAGALASGLTRSRGLAYAGAAALRLTVSIGLAASAFVLTALLSGQLEGALLGLSALGLGSGQLLLALIAGGNLGGLLLAVPLTLGLQAGALYGAVRLTIWRAEQLL
jgi:hypothetical protein